MTVHDAMEWAKAQTAGSTVTKAVLMALAERTGDRPVCCPSQELLADELEMSERSVRTHIRKLEARGLIVTRRRYLTLDGRPVARGRAFNEYELAVPVEDVVDSDQPATPAGGQPRPTGNSGTTNRQPVAGEQENLLAAAGGDQSSTGQVELPLVDPDPDGNHRAELIRAACQAAAERSVRADVDAGKVKVRSVPKYAQPRARDFLDRHHAMLAAMAAAGHGADAMVDRVIEEETGWQTPSPARPVEQVRPRLQEWRQPDLGETDAWQSQQPIDLAAHRDAIREARSVLDEHRPAQDVL